MDLMRTTNQLSRTKKTASSESYQKTTHDIIRSAFDSIHLPGEPKRKSRSTVGEEAIFCL